MMNKDVLWGAVVAIRRVKACNDIAATPAGAVYERWSDQGGKQ